MTEKPRITIITPSYNQGQFITETIESVLSQGYPNLEYIVIDGGSTDQTLDVLKVYDGRLFWVSQKDRGQSHAINKGLKRSTGDIISFLNSDDLLEPMALAKVAKFFVDHPEASWLTGKCRTVDPNGNEIRRWVTLYKNLWLRFANHRMLKVLNYISQPATFWRRQVIETVGYFDEQWQYAMDYDYSLRVGQHFRLWFLDEYLACFRIHPTSKAGASAHAQFDIDLEIAGRHVSSPLLIRLHALHNAMIVAIYRLLMARTGSVAD
jgi:glycosyltransferase involved in cell wall biosynthesis